MVRTIKQDGITKLLIDLDVTPEYEVKPHLIGTPTSKQRGAYIPGFHRMEYRLPGGDTLRIIAKDNQIDAPQVLLETHDPHLISNLPSNHSSSLVVSTINQIKQYWIRSLRYGSEVELTDAQLRKRQVCFDTIEQLKTLLGRERSLKTQDLKEQELLRNEIIALLEEARHQNRLVSDSIITSEGQFNQIFYTTTYQYVQEYDFNQYNQISRRDQLNFSSHNTSSNRVINSVLREIFKKYTLLSSDIKRINDYFCNENNLPVINRESLENLLSSIKSTRKDKTFLANFIQYKYPDIVAAHKLVEKTNRKEKILWDSTIHGIDSKDKINDLLLTLCYHYNISPPSNILNIKGNRFESAGQFFQQRWKDIQEVVDYCALKSKPTHSTQELKAKDIYLKKVNPFYVIKGKKQQSFNSLKSLVDFLSKPGFYDNASKLATKNPNEIESLLESSKSPTLILDEKNHIVYIKEDSLNHHQYFIDKGLYYNLPTGTDLYQVVNISSNHLYFIERFKLKSKKLISNLSHFFHYSIKDFFSFIKVSIPKLLTSYFYEGHIIKDGLRKNFKACGIELSVEQSKLINQLINTIQVDDISDRFPNNKHLSYSRKKKILKKKVSETLKKSGLTQVNTHIDELVNDNLYNLFEELLVKIEDQKKLISAAKQGEQQITEILKNKHLLKDSQTLESFLKDNIRNNPTILAQVDHEHENFHFNNPFNRSFNILKHLADFFVHYGEKNPIIGTLSTTLYLYAAASILCPQLLTALLSKMHLNFLIKAIKPTQELGKLMGNGTTSEIISAGMTYWQGVVLSGNFDKILTQFIEILQDDPVKVSALAGLTMGLGMTLCKIFPPLQEEMGRFPYPSYATLGAKSGAAIYDTISNPGNDFILGSLKWFLKQVAFIAYFFIGPFLEWAKFGFQDGFIFSIKKNTSTLIKKLKQTIAATTHLVLSIFNYVIFAAISFLVHVPFRGVLKIITKTLATLGNLKPLGEVFIQFGLRETGWDYISGFRLSPLFSFANPLRKKSDNIIINSILCILSFIVIFPLELVKNFVILPITETFALVTRITVTTLFNPLSRLLSLAAGSLIKAVGIITDKTIGIPLKSAASKLLMAGDTIDSNAGKAKRLYLSAINKVKLKLRLWAYPAPNNAIHTRNNEEKYFTEPFNYEANLGKNKKSALEEIVSSVQCQNKEDKSIEFFAKKSTAVQPQEQISSFSIR